MAISCSETDPWRLLGCFLYLYLLPFVCIVGLMLNIACLVVFSKRRSHPLVPALIVLSICDSLHLLFSIFVLYIPALYTFLDVDLYGVVAQIVYIATGTLVGGILALHCASIWTMCYISIQRHQAIVRPLSTVNTTQSSSFMPLLFISILALLFNMPVWFEFTWEIEKITKEDGTITSFMFHIPSELYYNEKYQFIMKKVLYPIAVYLIPLILISVLNMRILFYISYKRRMAKERRSVILLISIVLSFFICHTGVLVIRFFDSRKYINVPSFIFALELINFLININSFANPMLYFFFTRKFQDLEITWVANDSSNMVTKRLLKIFSTKSTRNESPV